MCVERYIFQNVFKYTFFKLLHPSTGQASLQNAEVVNYELIVSDAV